MHNKKKRKQHIFTFFGVKLKWDWAGPYFLNSYWAKFLDWLLIGRPFGHKV